MAVDRAPRCLQFCLPGHRLQTIIATLGAPPSREDTSKHPLRPVGSWVGKCPATLRTHTRMGRMAAMGLLLLVALTVSGFAPAAHGQQPQVSTQAPANAGGQLEAKVHPATVRYFNRDIFTLRTDLYGRTPQVRATLAAQAIDRIAGRGGRAEVAFRNLQEGTLVLLDGEPVFAFTPGDLDPLAGATMAQARAGIASALSNAVAEAEAANSPRRLAGGILWSLLATVIAVGIIVGVIWLGRRINLALLAWLQRRLAVLHHASTRQIASSVRAIGSWLTRIIYLVVVLVVLEEWLRFVLGRFAYTQPWSEAMRGWIARELDGWGQAILGAIPGLAVAIAVLLATRALTQAISITFRGVQAGRFKLFDIDADLAEPTRKIVVVVVWLFAIAIIYPLLPGAQTDAFKGLSVLVGLMVSLGASGIVAQAAGSFTILYSRTMRAGDLIKSGDTEGVVQQIGLFATRVRTITGVEVSIPNTVVLGNQLHNYSRNPEGKGMWLETGVTIGYDTPWRQVHKLLLGAAGRTAGVEARPASFVLQNGLDDFYADYRLWVWVVDVGARLDTLSALHASIQDEFNTAGVQIMSPHYERDPAEPKIVPPAQWNG